MKNPDTGELISDAEVAEVSYTAFSSTKYQIAARLIVRRVRDRNIKAGDGLDGIGGDHP